MSEQEHIDRKVVQIASRWIGTPYRHQGDQEGVGCDCLGLIRGIWRELYGLEPEAPLPYAKDWAEHSETERMLDAARRHCGVEIPLENIQPGCILLFRWRNGSVIKHAGILSSAHQFIHAYERIGVTQSCLVPSWRRRVAAAFHFPIS